MEQRTVIRVTVMLISAGLFMANVILAEDLAQPDPAKYRLGAQNRDVMQDFNGEASAWHAAYYASDFLDAYEAYGNTAWLEEAEKFYDFLISKLTKDPDGYEGWIGQTINKTSGLRSDALVGDAILLEPITRFAEIVLKDPKLKERFGQKAVQYVKLARRIIWEKWNLRGCYYEDAGYGGYHTADKYIDEKTGKWVSRPSMVVSDNLNKHYSAGIVILRLWRIDPMPEYRERLIKIYSRAKAMWRYYRDEDRVVWNFWMPQGPYDIEGKAPKSWVGVHPSRSGYQMGETRDWAEVYDSGLVFSQKDLERIIRTNHWMMDNGYKSADGTSDAGALWGGLARFDERIRKQHEIDLRKKLNDKNKIALAYLKNVTEKNLGWTRLHVTANTKPVVIDPPLGDGKAISMAIVIPSVVEIVNDAKVKLVTQTRVGGPLKIELLDKTGKAVLGEIFAGQAAKESEYSAPTWDGTNPKTGRKDFGDYIMRWSLAGETRVWPVSVRKGVLQADQGSKNLQPGQTEEEAFEKEPGQRWRIEGVVVSEDQAHGGKKSLKLINGSKAELVIGDDEDLPVRISFWVFDGGKNFGSANENGPMWGVGTAAGDKFVISAVWRKYLNGDNDYAWFNSGENQFFSPHPAKTGRFKGWSQWVFDFSQPGKVIVAGNDKPVGNMTAKFTPSGATAVFIAGGSVAAGPLYVDDMKVEYGKK